MFKSLLSFFIYVQLDLTSKFLKRGKKVTQICVFIDRDPKNTVFDADFKSCEKVAKQFTKKKLLAKNFNGNEVE